MRKDANIPRPHLRTDFTGRRYGRLVAIAPDAPGKWRYLCDCGNECVKSSSVVVQGSTSSCGCFRRESATKVCMSRVKPGCHVIGLGKPGGGLCVGVTVKSSKISDITAEEG